MSSSYRKALDAKEKLLNIIEKRISDGDSQFLKEFGNTTMDLEVIKNHVLVFICALIPKALASIMASFIDSARLWHPRYVDQNTHEISDGDLENILYEILRLWPPFVGSFRVAETDSDLAGQFHIPKGTGVFCVSLLAHRDPAIFPNPEEFDPERWNGPNKEDKAKIYAFGAGLHSCVGERLMWIVMKTLTSKFVKNFIWDFNPDFPQDTPIKYLPVSRPKKLTPLILRRY